ncbi:MAG TPA: CNNM domain-containing protein [Phycisphaerales bacterium]|nr:CNNM domain-containing protein [Phycisphaerales bacterium]HMP36221.1 CNNM domain-containing protein [Phycisphaerales bacterium]
MDELDAGRLFLALCLIPLLAGSAFFSGSETVLFGLGDNERLQFRRRTDLGGRAVNRLLAEPRMLLITVLLCNMTVNTLYMVISSVLASSPGIGWGETLLLGPGALVALIVVGEIVPKVAANAARMRFAPVVAPPLFVVHRVIGPLRVALERAVVAPLARLTAPAVQPPRITAEELAALLSQSGEQGVIDSEEQRLLRQVVRLRRLRVRDVMTPRMRMETVRTTSARSEVVAISRRFRFTRLPVHRGDLDEIVGLLPVKTYLLDPRGGRTPIEEFMERPLYVPEIATLEQLLELFRARGAELAIVVDERGGTAGIVAAEDVVEEIVGDIVSPEERAVEPPRRAGAARWIVDGDMGVHDWSDFFGEALISPHVATVGGLVLERLGHVPAAGECVVLGNVSLEVLRMDGHRVAQVAVDVDLNRDGERAGAAAGGTVDDAPPTERAGARIEAIREARSGPGERGGESGTGARARHRSETAQGETDRSGWARNEPDQGEPDREERDQGDRDGRDFGRSASVPEERHP